MSTHAIRGRRPAPRHLPWRRSRPSDENRDVPDAGASDPADQHSLRLLDLLGEAALEISAQLPNGHVDVRLAGQEPSLVYVEDEPAPTTAAPSGEDAASARITLRLTESLKLNVELAANREGVSVNTWIVRALGRAASANTTRRVGRRLTGYAQS